MKKHADGNRIRECLRQLAGFSASVKGVTRLPFSEEAQMAADYLMNEMEKAGLKTYMDNTGAVHGIRRGRSSNRIVIGSHYDSVPEGGAFDGIAGVICGIELAQLMQNIDLGYGLEILAFNDEEGVRFGGGFLSSKALLGELEISDLRERRDAQGISIYEAAASAGFHPDDIVQKSCNLDNIRGFFEIHVEQGGVLEYGDKHLGLVSGIVGIWRYRIELTGQADHAGTTPMELRHDALLPAAAVIMAANQAALAHPGAVATVGSVQIEPGAVNTVAGKVVLSLDLRSMKNGELDAMAEAIFAALNQSADRSKVTVAIVPTLISQPGYMDEDLQQMLVASAHLKNVEPLLMTSGAGHDSLPISAKVPTAMLFVPSRDGRSHCPEEWSDCQDLALAVDVLSDTILTINMEV